MDDVSRPHRRRISRTAAQRPLRDHGRDRAAGLVRSERSAGEGAAAARDCRCGQRHRRGRRPNPSERAGGCADLLEAGIEPILQLTCRDRNRIALQGDLLGAAALGVHNLLLLTGDDPTSGDQPETKAVYDLDSRALTETARMIRGSRRAAVRTKDRRPRPVLSRRRPTCRSIRPPGGSRPRSKAKIAAGAQFVQTQFCMDAGVMRRYLGRLREAGIDIFRPGRARAAALGGKRALDAKEPARHHHRRCGGRRAWRRPPIRRPRGGASAPN